MFVLSSMMTILLLINTVYGSTICDSPKMCKDLEISDDFAICSGFRGCDGATIATTSSIYCYGAYGCMNATSLIADGSVYCNGMYGCYNTTEILAGGNVYCDGYYGCREVNE
eukprot:249709_1